MADHVLVIALDPGQVAPALGAVLDGRALAVRSFPTQLTGEDRMAELRRLLPGAIMAIRNEIVDRLNSTLETGPTLAVYFVVEDQYMASTGGLAAAGRIQAMKDVILVRGYGEQAAADAGLVVLPAVNPQSWKSATGVLKASKLAPARLKTKRDREKWASLWLAAQYLGRSLSRDGEADALNMARHQAGLIAKGNP